MQPENFGTTPSPYPTAPPPYPVTPLKRPSPNIGLIVGIAVVVVLAGLGIFHYTGPTGTVHGYVNDIFVKFDATDAYSRLCSDAQAKITLGQIQSSVKAAKSGGIVYGTSGITYNLIDENFFGTAHVRLGGTITVTTATGTTKLPANGTATLITLRSTGLGWCLTGATL